MTSAEPKVWMILKTIDGADAISGPYTEEPTKVVLAEALDRAERRIQGLLANSESLVRNRDQIAAERDRYIAEGADVVPLHRYSEKQVRECLTDILPYWVHKDDGEGADVERTVAYLVNEITRRLREPLPTSEPVFDLSRGVTRRVSD